MSNVKKYTQTKTTKFEFNGPHGVFSVILGLPFTVIALALMCSEKGCPPDLGSLDVMDKIYNTVWFDSESMMVFKYLPGCSCLDGISFRHGYDCTRAHCVGDRATKWHSAQLQT